MKQRIGYAILATAVALSALGQPTDSDRSLIGLRRIGLKVQISNRVLSVSGLTIDDVQRKATEKLRGAGLVILSKSELRKEPGYPILLLDITDIVMSPPAPNAPDIVYTTTVFFYQDVVPTRLKVASLSAPTWSTVPIISLMKLRSRSYIAEDVSENALGSIDVFLKSYGNINRKR
jgi:hypothetical protein